MTNIIATKVETYNAVDFGSVVAKFVGDWSQTGVYSITNTSNGKRYIGSAAYSFRVRWYQHITHLRKGDHHNKALQSAYRLYGEASFCFSIELICEPGMCLSEEQAWLDREKTYLKAYGYNTCGIAGSRKGQQQSEATKEKIRQALVGHSVSEQTRDKLSKVFKGRRLSQDTKDKMAEARRGGKRSPETKLKMSLARKAYFARKRAEATPA